MHMNQRAVNKVQKSIIELKSSVMKTKVLFVLVLSALITTPGFSQEKTKKELKAERKIEKQKQTEAIGQFQGISLYGQNSHASGRPVN